MQELLDKLKENSILGVEVKANLSISPGKSGTIITKDKKVYGYSLYVFMTQFMEKNNIPLENIYLIKELTDEEYDKILKFIQEEIISKEYECRPQRDSSSIVFGRRESKLFYYPNCYDVNTNENLYDKTIKLIEEVK